LFEVRYCETSWIVLFIFYLFVFLLSIALIFCDLLSFSMKFRIEFSTLWWMLLEFSWQIH
jgi:hypothetical protein